MKSQGWSLFECLVVVALVAILSCAVAPSFYSMILRLEATLFVNQLVRTLNTAKVMAMNEDEEVSFCLTRDKESCVAGPARAYQLFTYHEGQSRRVMSGQTKLPLELVWQGFSKGDKTTFIQNGECLQNGRLLIRSTQLDFHWNKVIVINLTGRIRVEKGGVNSGLLLR